MQDERWQLLPLLSAFALAVTSASVARATETQECPTGERHRVSIENTWDGQIRGSRDGGKSWTLLGKIKVPVQGEYWIPGRDNGVLAFNYLRGESSVFASAVNNLHIRFSDPEGYTLPKDTKIAPVDGHGVSFAPAESALNGIDPTLAKYTAVTSIPGGTGIFGSEWSPRVGDKVVVRGGKTARALPYEFSLLPGAAESELVIVTNDSSCDIEYLEFENSYEGRVLVKKPSESARVIAKVKQPVLGVGRFVGSEFISQPGVIRANHAGVLDVGTTDINIDPQLPRDVPLSELRGGFQIVPSHHYADPSMRSGGDHPFVYMVVGPIIDPPHLERYDMGVEATHPLFYQGLRAGNGMTYFQFNGDESWYEVSHAMALQKFKTRDGVVVKHLRGIVRDVFHNVARIRVVNKRPQSQTGSITGSLN